MTTPYFLRRLRTSGTLLGLVAGLILVSTLSACKPDAADIDTQSETYREAVSAFYSALAALQVGQDQRAEARLTWLTENVPGEPAAWANLAVMHLRHSKPDEARSFLEQARRLAPDHVGVLMVEAAWAASLDQPEAAISALRRASELEPSNTKVLFTLAQTLEQLEPDTSAEEVEALLSRILEIRPENVAALLQTARMAARSGNVERTRDLLSRLSRIPLAWPDQALGQLNDILNADPAPAPETLLLQVSILQNIMLRSAAYRQSLSEMQIPVEQVAELIPHFIALPAPSASPATADDSLRFDPMPPILADEAWATTLALPLDGESPPAVIAGNSRHVRVLGGVFGVSDRDAQMINELTVPFPGKGSTPVGHRSLRLADTNYDYLLDIVLAGPGGFRLFLQDSSGTFRDATTRTGLAASVTGRAYDAVWAVDFDLEGDLDLVLGAAGQAPTALRNNGDETFTVMPVFIGVSGLRDFAWADFDADGDPDAAIIDDAGILTFFRNQRGGRFDPVSIPGPASPFVALATADLDRNGLIDLVGLTRDGSIVQLRLDGQPETLARWADMPPDAPYARLLLADLDNNAGIDVVASVPGRTAIWLRTPDDTLTPLAFSIEAMATAAIDLTADGRLDLLALSNEGQIQRLVNQSTRSYHWQQLRPRAATVSGDQRINSFGIGGEIEVRAGTLYQKQPVDEPIVHFGMGDQLVTDVTRIIWPNGDVQAEFDLLSGVVISAQQRLKGSCPWLFTYDGEGMRFVTDFIWRSPLGLRINALETAGVATTTDWVKIRGDQLVPRDGFYDVRITAELWETHFFDHVSLLVVDHPENTEVFIDERFVFPPPEMTPHLTTPPRAVRRVRTDAGQDVTDRVRDIDQQYLDFAGRGAYQGITRSHAIEIELGDGVPVDRPIALYGFGWLRPTDSSINVAIGQGSHPAPQGLRLEVADGDGPWRLHQANLGFPAGKTKSVLLDLSGAFQSDADPRVRLTTNLEIYWDHLAWVEVLQNVQMDTLRLQPKLADLRYRGFSEVTEVDRSSPELPAYDRLVGTHQLWRDLEGYYTRFGPVNELLADVDDRYVIMNAGDEMRFTFAAPPDPKPGMQRSFVLIGDGWVKDGDLNTTFSKTVLPLPYHADAVYETPPTTLENDPVYRRFPEDWLRYHTRYVAPEAFHQALLLPRKD